MSQLPNGAIAFGPSANCTLDICPLEASILRYQPSIPANGTFIAVFALAMVLHAIQGIRAHTWGFLACMISGCILEVVGYIGRLIIHGNPFDFSGFLMQIICVTIAPVFFCSAIYVLLSQVINHIDRSISRFDPRFFYWIFIPCDIISLVLQAAGGALSSTGGTEAHIQVGVNISLSGLVFQVVTLVVFCVSFADYLITCKRTPPWNHVTKKMTQFLAFTFLSTLFILIRCVYRIVELHDGYFSHFFRDEPLFIALESVIMCIAVFCLNCGHPGMVFGVHKGKSSRHVHSISSMDTIRMDDAHHPGHA
ncbi:parasitic phase-specific protein psp-1 [Ilyonectria robusta]